jgi:hypothetical protein
MPRAKGPKQPVSSLPEVITREEAMLRERLAGKPIRRIAAEFGCSAEEAQGIIVGMCTSVTTQMKLHTVELELERLDELVRAFHAKALQGDAPSAAVLLRVQERRAMLLGTDSPLKVDAVQVHAEAAPHQSSIDRIMAAMQRLAAQPNGGQGEDIPRLDD